MSINDSNVANQSPRIVLVGHCAMDATSLKRAASQAVADAQIASANDEQSLRTYTQPNSLLLVNRVLDGQFEAEDGIALIKKLAGQSPAPRMMLISNFPQAQQQAQAAGAQPGFGKADAHEQKTAQMLADTFA